MPEEGQPYTSGDWLVKEGSEEEFVSAWTEFTDWSAKNARGAQSFVLIRQADDPRHFLSFGAWEDAEAVDEWRSRPEFRERMGACRALCDEFGARDFRLAVSR